MGAGISCLPRYGCCVPRQHPNTCKENHVTTTSTPRKHGGHRRNLSAAFNLADLEDPCNGNVELLNVNAATEEELMTLPGVNRQTAHNIIEYRKQIGAFKKVEDLALVSGVGATKLGILRMEICVRNKNGMLTGIAKSSSSSSTSSSRQDVSLLQPDNISRSSSKSASGGCVQLVSINTSNVFTLMKVKGITQTLAENIVMHREKRGPYRSVDDLLKVKGIKPYLLSATRQYFTVAEVAAAGGDSVEGGARLGYNNNSGDALLSGNLITQSFPPPLESQLSNASSQEDMISLYGPLTKKSFRGVRRKLYYTKRNNRPVMRIATWNLQQCGEQKANNPGVKEVVAMTVLENGLSIVGVQELGDSEALHRLCDELNQPTIPNVKKFSGHRGSWKCVTSDEQSCGEHLGFLYDESRGVQLLRHTSLHQTGAVQDPPPLWAVFQVKELTVGVVNVHIKQDELREQILQGIIHALEEQGENDVLVVGDFSTTPDSQECHCFHIRGYHPALSSHTYTNISMRNPEGSHCQDNIWLAPNTNKQYTGTADVIREGLTSPWIPDGWGWGGLASDHCPAYAELYVDDAHSKPQQTAAAQISVKDIQVALKMGVAGAEL